MNQGRDADRLRPITVRFSQGAYDAIQDTADDNCISKAELVRMAVAGNLGRDLVARAMSPRVGDGIGPIGGSGYMRIRHKIAKANAPDCQSSVYVQMDGKGHKVHLHILTNDVTMTDPRA